MHQTIRSLAALLLLVSAGLNIGWVDTWDSIRLATGKVQTIEAEFVQTKYMKILVRPLVSKGVFRYKAPSSLRWEYHQPFRSILLMHDGNVKKYHLDNGVAREDAGSRVASMQFVLQEITRWLNGRFDQNPLFQAELAGNRQIILTPKNASMQHVIAKIELNLSAQPGVIESVTIFETEHSYTRIEFHNVHLNRQLEDALFINLS
jgi:outer membrane lipoprotein-sorting protein